MAEDKNNIYVTSHNQSGGITAHTVNVGPQPRNLDADSAAQLVQMIQAGSAVNVVAVMGDQEAFQFASQIKSFLLSKGYSVSGVDQAAYSEPVVGQFLNKTGDGYEIRIGSRG